jgi:hypothetical protein
MVLEHLYSVRCRCSLDTEIVKCSALEKLLSSSLDKLHQDWPYIAISLQLNAEDASTMDPPFIIWLHLTIYIRKHQSIDISFETSPSRIRLFWVESEMILSTMAMSLALQVPSVSFVYSSSLTVIVSWLLGCMIVHRCLYIDCTRVECILGMPGYIVKAQNRQQR